MHALAVRLTVAWMTDGMRKIYMDKNCEIFKWIVIKINSTSHKLVQKFIKKNYKLWCQCAGFPIKDVKNLTYSRNLFCGQRKTFTIQNFFKFSTTYQIFCCKLHSDATICKFYMRFWNVNGVTELFELFFSLLCKIPLSHKSCSVKSALGNTFW